MPRHTIGGVSRGEADEVLTKFGELVRERFNCEDFSRQEAADLFAEILSGKEFDSPEVREAFLIALDRVPGLEKKDAHFWPSDHFPLLVANRHWTFLHRMTLEEALWLVELHENGDWIPQGMIPTVEALADTVGKLRDA